jgi:protein-tyrosine-phosphatase
MSNKKVVIFVCTSNTCRSPAAEGLASLWLVEHGFDQQYVVYSRSISTDYEPENSTPSEFSTSVMLEDFNVDISSHRSQLLSSVDVQYAHLIVGITRNHCSYILNKFPEAEGKCISMSVDIPDPWHSSKDIYRHCIHSMHGAMDETFRRIMNYR